MKCNYSTDLMMCDDNAPCFTSIDIPKFIMWLFNCNNHLAQNDNHSAFVKLPETYFKDLAFLYA